MKKMLVIMCAMFVLTMFATVSAHGNPDNLSTSDHRIVAVDGPDGPHDPPQPPHKHKKHKPKPQPQPGPGPQPRPGPNGPN